MPQTGGPVPEFTAAVEARDVQAAAALLAPDVHLSIPPLHYARQGAGDVAEGIAGLLGAFGELRYELRSRYLDQSCVTDEAVVTGRQTGTFLGAPPSRRVSAVSVRMIVGHDDVCITHLTLWPDLAALRTAVAVADRVIDLTTASRAGGLITELRATVPPRQTRIVVGTPRWIPPQLSGPPPTPRAPVPAAGPSRPVPKAPVPKSVRRRRAVLAGATMLAAAAALTTWVALGALSLPGTTPVTIDTAAGATGGSDGGAPRVSSAATRGVEDAVRPGSSDGDGSSTDGSSADMPPDDLARLAPAAQLATGQNTVVIGSDLLFATDSATLTPRARRILADLIVQARRKDRHGRIVVNGYTDDVGTERYNRGLSRRRAAAVAAVLRAGLARGGTTVESHGYGESHPRGPNTSEAARQANRRVTVQFPPQG